MPKYEKTTLPKLIDCLMNETNQVKIPKKLREDALKPLKKMLKLSK